MKKLLSVALALSLCAPAFAQRPKLEQSIAVGDVTMSLNYTSLPFAEGKTMAALMAKDGGQMRTMMNDRSSARPLATFTSSVEVKCGELTLPAGEHKLYFTIGDDLKWSANFKMGDKVQSMKLTTTDASEHMSKQLLMCLYPEPNGAAGAYVAFGNVQTMLSFVPAGAAKTDAGKPAPAK